jgi:hypothetical protein
MFGSGGAMVERGIAERMPGGTRSLYSSASDAENGRTPKDSTAKVAPKKANAQMSQPLVAGGQQPQAQPHRLSPEIQARIREAQAAVSEEVAMPMIHGRLCIGGLSMLAGLRVAAWWQSILPGYAVLGMHVLTTVSDVACLIFSMPLFTAGIPGRCVQHGCLGPMLTLVFAMSLVDISAFVAYLVVATPQPLSPGAKSFVDVLQACIGVWEFALVASVALQVSLCISTWRIYKELRVVGLYPPDSDPAKVGTPRQVSVMEVVCEAEDVEVLSNCEVVPSCGPSCCANYRAVPLAVESAEVQTTENVGVHHGHDEMSRAAAERN